MSGFASNVSSDSEEDEEYEKRSAESNRKAKLEMERLRAKKSLERKREELKRARELREEAAREEKLRVQREKSEEALRDALLALDELGLSPEERSVEETRIIREQQQQPQQLLEVPVLAGNSAVLTEEAQSKILEDLANAYLENDNSIEGSDNNGDDNDESSDQATIDNDSAVDIVTETLTATLLLAVKNDSSGESVDDDIDVCDIGLSFINQADEESPCAYLIPQKSDSA
jgi:hypothetical protein